MNRTQDTSKAAPPPVGTAVLDLKGKEIEIPEFPHFTGELSIYFGKIHYRAEAITPALKGIPGFFPDKN